MCGKLSRLQDLPHSKMMRKLVVPETQYPQGIHAQLFRLFTMLRLGPQIRFLPQKSASLAEPQRLIFRGVHCHPEEGGTISYRFSERHCHCSECKWAEELNRWLQ